MSNTDRTELLKKLREFHEEAAKREPNLAPNEIVTLVKELGGELDQCILSYAKELRDPRQTKNHTEYSASIIDCALWKSRLVDLLNTEYVKHGQKTQLEDNTDDEDLDEDDDFDPEE